MKKILLSLVMVAAMLTGVTMATTENVSAAASTCDKNASTFFFGLRPWYYGLTDEKCEIVVKKTIPVFIWTIVLNILTDISILIGYIAIVMIAWGGYLYMFSRGMPDRAEKGKKTLISAVIGLLISLLASVIMNTVVAILTGES